MNIQQLNQQHAIDGHLEIVEGPGGLPQIKINSSGAEALVSLYGAQVLSYKPREAAQDLLFTSEAAYYQPGKAIKGGIPLCWPWFGYDPLQQGRPAHGFARTRMWKINTGELLADGDVRLVLGMQVKEDPALWPHTAEVLLEITVGSRLDISLVTKNPGADTLSLTKALHSYFLVGDINQVEVSGLEDRWYLDKADAWKKKQQSGAIQFDAEVDRVYLDVLPELLIQDHEFQRRIRIRSRGNKTAVVWNPWKDIAKQMADLQDADYLRFVCVETTNAADDLVEIAPGGAYRLEVSYLIEDI